MNKKFLDLVEQNLELVEKKILDLFEQKKNLYLGEKMLELGEQNLGWVEQKCLILLKYLDLVKNLIWLMIFTWLLCILIWLKFFLIWLTLFTQLRHCELVKKKFRFG